MEHTFSDVDAAAPEVGDVDGYDFDVHHWSHDFHEGCLRPEKSIDT